jgi:hypothetical protein
VFVEGTGVEVRVAVPLGERKGLHRFRLRIDAHDGVEAAFGHPGGAVGTNDHPVRRRAVAEGDVPDGACIRIEPPKRALSLGGVPYGAIRRRSDIVWAGALRNGIVADLLRGGTRGHRAEQRGEQRRRNRTKHGELLTSRVSICTATGPRTLFAPLRRPSRRWRARRVACR